MARYRYLPEQTTSVLGIFDTETNEEIPPNTEIAAWNEFVAWDAVGGQDPDPFVPLSLTVERDLAKIRIDRDCETSMLKYARFRGPRNSMAAACYFATIMEAERYANDATPTAAEFEFLNALIGTEGATLALVQTAVNIHWQAVKANIVAANQLRWKGHKDVDAAGSIAAIRAVPGAITWP